MPERGRREHARDESGGYECFIVIHVSYAMILWFEQ